MRNSLFSRLATFAVLAMTLGIVPLAWGQYTETTIYSFTGGNDGSLPTSGLIFDPQGNLYGTTVQGGSYGYGTVFRLAPQSGGGWSETVLFDFSDGTDGGNPLGGLIIDGQGNLYGTTNSGGSTSCLVFGDTFCGVVFKLTPQTHGRWKETVLHAFQNNARDGFFPYAGLAFDAAGNLYGTTYQGGAYNLGVVFELIPTTSGPWKERILHSFAGLDGAFLYSGLVLDQAGNVYGTTRQGGNINTANCNNLGCGVVFKLTSTSSGRWNEHVLYSFTNNVDGSGSYPIGTLILDGAGNLYGTASGGSSTNCSGYPCGVVFEVSKGAGGLWAEKVLYSFAAGNDGMFPGSGVILDSVGNLYGTTADGGGGPHP